MSGRRELHLRVRGVSELCVPGQPFQTHDTYCVCSYGDSTVRPRTRVVEDSASPQWNEEFVFDASLLSAGHEPVLSFEVYSQAGMVLLPDELLFFAYLPLDEDSGLQDLQQQQQQQQQRRARVVSHEDGDAAAAPPAAEDLSALAAQAAAPRHSSAARVPLASAARAAAQEAAAAASSAALRGRGSPGCSSAVSLHRLALLPAQGQPGSGSSGGGGLLGAARSGTFGRSAPAKTFSKTRLKRSSHVRSAGELVVEVWWVQQPSLGNAGTPPRVLSFVHPPGSVAPLPSVSHSSLASQWEEPPVAFVRLLVGRISLGGAVAAAAAAAAQAGDDSAAGQAKAVLKALRALLKGDAAAAAEEHHQQQQQDQPLLRSRPTLADIHSTTSVQLSVRGDAGDSGSLGGWDWQALGLDDDEDEAQGQGQQHARTGASGDGSSSQQQQQHPMLSQLGRSGGTAAGSSVGNDDTLTGSSSGDECDDISLLESEFGVHSQQQDEHRRRRRLLRFGRRQQRLEQQQRQQQRRSARNQAERALHVSLRLQLGQQRQQQLRAVPLRPDGSADVCQAAVFAVARPLEESAVTYELGLGLGPSGAPLLSLTFQYSLLHLLRRSPPRPVTWQEWRLVARCTVSGLQVPLPVLPGSYLDLSAFLADADCRAGMYGVPPVSAAAAAAAALDDQAAATVASMAARAAAAEAAAAAVPARLRGEPEAEALTDSENEEDRDDADYRAAQDQLHTAGSSHSSSAASSGGLLQGVLRRRPAPAAASKQQHAAAAGKQYPQQHGLTGLKQELKGRAAAGVEAMLGRVEEGLAQAVERLPEPVAQQVKGRFMSKLFPQTRRSEVFSIGQLRVMSKPASAHTAAAPQQQQQQQQQQHGKAVHFEHSSSSVFAAGVPASLATATDGAATPPLGSQAHGSLDAWLAAAGSSGSPAPGSPHCSAGLGSAGSSAQQQQQQQQQQGVVPLEQHPNLATAGGPGSAPLGVLQVTLQALSLRSRNSSSSLSLLMRCGPHWLQLQQPALPLTFYNSSGAARSSSASSGCSSSDGGLGSRVPPVQVLLPVYGSSVLVSVLVHRKGHVVGRCVFKLYGLLPLLLRDHSKSLTLYSDKRGSRGQRIIAGSMLLCLAAGPPPGYSRPGAALRLAYSYMITPHTLELHTSGVLAGSSRDERDDAAGRLVTAWLRGAAGQGDAPLPEALVAQLVSSGRGHVSASRMRGHVHRLKAVALDWLPRRLDPLAFYHWRHPLHNLLFLWLLSHLCLYPGRWLLTMAVVVTLLLLRRIAIQIRRGVLGFELEQLPPDMAEAAGLTQQQQQQQGGQAAAGAAGDDPDERDPVRQLHSLRSSGPGGLGDRQRYREAADRLRQRLAGVGGHHSKDAAHSATTSASPASPPGAGPPPFPRSLQELREQLEAGTLSMEQLDLDAAAAQLLSVGGLLKLARTHSGYALDYLLLLQNLLDDAAGFAEGLYAMLTAQDPLAALLFCCILLSSGWFCCTFGLGAGVFVVLCVLLRPPLLRGVPGVFGWKALLANLPSRSVEEAGAA